MRRILYNIDGWFQALQIHQQILWVVVLVFPMLLGILSQNIVLHVIGVLFYVGGLLANWKGQSIRYEAQNILYFYDSKFKEFRTGAKWGDHDKGKLVGYIMLEKKFDGKFRRR